MTKAKAAQKKTEAPKAPGQWLKMIETRQSDGFIRNALLGRDHAEEYLLMSIRLSEGMNGDRFAALAGTPLAPERLEHLAALGLLSVSDGRIRATASGRMVLNAIIRELAMS